VSEKENHMKMCLILNGYPDRAAWMWRALHFPLR